LPVAQFIIYIIHRKKIKVWGKISLIGRIIVTRIAQKVTCAVGGNLQGRLDLVQLRYD